MMAETSEPNVVNVEDFTNDETEFLRSFVKIIEYGLSNVKFEGTVLNGYTSFLNRANEAFPLVLAEFFCKHLKTHNTNPNIEFCSNICDTEDIITVILDRKTSLFSKISVIITDSLYQMIDDYSSPQNRVFKYQKTVECAADVEKLNTLFDRIVMYTDSEKTFIEFVGMGILHAPKYSGCVYQPIKPRLCGEIPEEFEKSENLVICLNEMFNNQFSYHISLDSIVYYRNEDAVLCTVNKETRTMKTITGVVKDIDKHESIIKIYTGTL